MKKIAALAVALITYGSLWPFDYVPHAASWADVRYILFDWPAHLSIISSVSNVILFVPLGVLIPALSRRFAARFALFCASVFFAWILQYFQFWFPVRTPDVSAAVFNVVGLGMGLLLHSSATAVLNRLQPVARNFPAFWQVPTALMGCWVLYRWFPLMPSLDVQNVKNALKPLFRTPHFDWVAFLHDAVAWLVFLRLSRYSAAAKWNRHALALACVAIVLAEPAFEGKLLSWANVAGVLAAVAARPVFYRGKASLLALLILQFLSLCLSELQPFRFTAHARFLWLPFSGMMQGSVLVDLDALIEKTYVYGSLLFLLDYYGVRLRTAAATEGLLLFGLEWMQQYIPGRTPETTDGVLALVLGVGMSWYLNNGKSIARERERLLSSFAPRRR